MTDTIHIPTPKPLMIAHRGVSGIECENTCPAFTLAGSRSYYGIETDVHVARDGTLVICHDDNLSRVAGRPDVIEDSTWDVLKDVCLCNPRTKEYRRDYILPLLSDYIAICRKYGKRAILELKRPMTLEAVESICRVLQDADFEKQVTFISFARKSIENVRIVLPDSECQYLCEKYDDEILDYLDRNGFDIDIGYGALTEKIVADLHAHGHKVNCWTVDSPDDARRLTEYGVDMITTNILE